MELSNKKLSPDGLSLCRPAHRRHDVTQAERPPMGVYDWFLMLGVLYTGLGSDLFLNWGAGLIIGGRLRPDSPNFFERIYYQVHARGDPNMRATPPA
jgi:hypothetical protein